jgi:2-keto-4-pentenoate hydratase/2-oxohepta-3-ene-1,7-dioic acid hydratase in catechol pathway
MKIICIGRNYSAHAKELGNAIPDEPVVFLKPPSALIPHGGPIRLPSFSNDIHHEIELVYSIRRHNGRAEADRVTIGLDLTARDVQQALKTKGLPWEKAKAFDGSAYVAEAFSAVESFPAGKHIEFMLKKNGQVVQSGHSGQMMHDVAALIAHVEQYMQLASCCSS